MKSIFLYFIGCILLFISTSSSFGQVLSDFDDFSIFYGDIQKSKSYVESLTPMNDGSILCVQNKSSLIRLFSKNKWKYSFDILENFKLPKMHGIDFYGLGKKSTLFNYTLLNNKVLGFSYRPSFGGRSPSLFYHLINIHSSAKNNYGSPLRNFRNVHGKIDLSRITARSDKNGDYASILYLPRTSGKEYPTIEYAVFNKNFSAPNEYRLVYPHQTNEFEIIDFFVVDTTHQVLITALYPNDMGLDNKNNSTQFLKHLEIVSIQEGIIQGTNIISHPGVLYLDIHTFKVGGRIFISGIYTNNALAKIEGVMYAEINEQGRLVNQQFIKFNDRFHSAMAIFLKNDSYRDSHFQSETSAFKILDFLPYKDGFIQVAEFQSKEYRYSPGDVYGSGSSMDVYYWRNNIIISKIDTTGKLIWNRIIPKLQRTVNDNGYYSSAAIYQDTNFLHLFFNDNIENYDEDQKYYITEEVPKMAAFSDAKNTVAHVKINLDNGNVFRRRTIGKEKTDVYMVPQLSVSLPKQNKLLIYGRRGKKQRFGAVNFH